MADDDDGRDNVDVPGAPGWQIEPTLLEQLPRTGAETFRAAFNQSAINAHYSALGQVAAAWAAFEATVDLWLWHFAEMPQKVGICFTSQMIGPRPRMDAFVALVRHLGARKGWFEKLETLAKEAGQIGERRNRALHDIWDMSNPQMPHRREATARRSVRYLDIHQPTANLISLVNDIVLLTKRFEDDFANAIYDEIYPSPDKSPQG